MEFIYRAAPLVAFLIGIVLTVLVIRHKPRSSIHRAFALFLSSMALWGLTLSGMRVSPSLDQALPWGKATVAVLPFVSISFFHFVQLLTGSRRTRFLIIPGYAAAILAVLPASSGLVISEMKPMWYGYGFNSGPLLLPYMAVFYGIVGWGIYQLARASRTADTQQDRNRSAYVALGGVVMLLGLMTDVLASQGAPAYPMGIIGNIFFSLINTYAILRYQLLDIQVVIRKGAVYAIVSAVGVGFVIGILSVAYALVPESTRLSAWENVVVIMVLAIGIQPVLHIVQTRVDRWFDRGKYDYLKAVEKLGETTTSIIDLKHLSETLADTVALAVKTDEVSVLLPDSEERDFVAVAGQPMRLPGHSILVWWLRERQEILSQKEIETYPQFQAVTAQERVLQARMLVDTWVPMVTREGLRGILALGRKLSDQDYSAEEMSMLRVVARQMADSLDIARMYDLKDKRLREQALLTRLSTIVSSEPDLNKVYSLFIEEMRSSIPLDQAEITLEEKANDAETTVFSWTSPGTASGQMKSEARLALPTKGGLLGHLGMASVAQDAYPKDTNRLLEQIAFQLSIAIDNARLYDLERQARRELEQEFRERTEFVDALIHEVKTPITAMQASSELLREELAGHPSILGELAANMDASVKNLDRRISELVEFVRLQNTEIRLRTVRVPVKSLVDVAAVAIGPLLHTKGQTLRIHVDPCLGEVRADPERVSQVLLNLLTNAAKFSGPNTLVSLRVFSKDESVVFQLRDEAPPLQEEERERLFKPYQRGQKKGGGLGLGLFICRKLVQLHGGQMWSETDAEGNKFCFSLPDTEEEEEE